MRRPGHAGDHQTAVVIDGTMGILFWAPEEETEPELAVIEDEVSVAYFEQALETVKNEAYGTAAPQPRAYRESDLVGRRRSRKTEVNLYAAPDEGIHTNWNIFGHEILPFPMQDEIELAHA